MQRDIVKATISKMRAQLDALETQLATEPTARFAEGPPPFGFQAQRRTQREIRMRIRKPLVENPKEQRVIARVVELREAGKKYEEIAGVLNDEGHRTRAKGHWQIAGVQRIFERRI